MSEKFQKYTQIEHVLNRPGMYLGSIDNTTEDRWFINKDLKAERGSKVVNPGLEHCCVELIVNAIDHSQRCITDVLENVTKIECFLNKTEFIIINNGKGIPIEIHKEHKIYIPELVFGNMLTSSNYDDTKDRLVGGTNGIGGKIAAIFSKNFTIELVTDKQKYIQVFSNNLSKKTEPVITKTKSKDYVKITFEPDFKRFKMSSFESNDTGLMIIKRIYDASATTNKKVSVLFNDIKIPIKEFKDYTDLYLAEDSKKVYFEHENWSIVAALNPFDTNTSISFVNGICTEDGGTHNNYIVDQITKKVLEEIQNLPRVKKDNITIKSTYIKEQLIIFIRCLVVNPRFNSQTKRKLETPSSEFGSKCVIPEDIISKISKLGLIDQIIELARAKDLSAMKKATNSTVSVKKRIIVPKLDDAEMAGSKQSDKCRLIICEGDSAKSMIMSGLTVVSNKYYGIFPVKGKPLNVRTATVSQLTTNEEIININKILGLVHGMKDKSKLRYGGIIIFVDADVDASHLCALLVNYITNYWPEIVEAGFISRMITPVVKVQIKNSKKNDELEFYNLYDFKKWKSLNNDSKYSLRYYKGLGTSNKDEAKQYFRDIEKNNINYSYDPKIDEERLLLAFDKKNADLRKKWISDAIVRIDKEGSAVDYKQKNISISSLIDNELVQFSIYDCERSLPSIIDGLKISQRKVLYGSTLKKIYGPKDQTKVAQLGAYIAEKCQYHHGEISLFETIIGMAQEFTGSGNSQIFYPSGQFGSRNFGGHDSASPRYIFTYLNKWVPIMFNEIDSKILEYKYEDDEQIEPVKYVPVLPMCLLQGAVGIATGFSCNIPCFRPKDVIDNIKSLIKDPDSDIKKMNPYYKYFKGTISEVSPNKWVSSGIYERQSPKKILIKELPIGLWYENFKDLLKKLETSDILTYKDTPIQDKNGQDFIEFLVTFENQMTDDEVVKLLHLETSINATNMVGFDSDGHIHKYESPEEILWEFYEVRLELYKKRKIYMENAIVSKLKYISEKARFIKLIVTDKLIVNKKKRIVIVKELEDLKFTIIDDLLSLSISSLTEERIAEFNKEIDNLTRELEELKSSTSASLWLNDIKLLEPYFADV